MTSLIIFLALAIFSFGQIIKIGFLQPIDIVVGVGALWAILKKMSKPIYFRFVNLLLAVLIFSFIASIPIFASQNLIYGFLYLLRLAAYLYFYVLVWNFVRENNENRKVLLKSLLALSTISAIFGWIQYVFYPNIKAFTIWGWDDHYLRLTGTFLDPTFLGLIIAFGIFVSLYYYANTKKKYYILMILFLIISLAFTYSRASYLALFGGLLIYGITYKNYLKNILILVCGFMLLMLILPTSNNHILSFTRVFSAMNRIQNYKNTLLVFQKYPLFGVGYNNFCLGTQQIIGEGQFVSHACSGSDSSLLLILATTGVFGFVVFLYCLKNVFVSIRHSAYYILLATCSVALAVHSFFSNSLFYPWAMLYIVILFAVATKE